MRKTDILLIVLFIVLILGIAFGPGLIEQWRARDAGTGIAEQAQEPETVDLDESEQSTQRIPPDQEAEVERVSGMLMLHKACVERFEDFGNESSEVAAAWEKQYGELLAVKPEQDFRIVLAQPQGLDEAAKEKARNEELALCQHNLEAMRADLAGSSQP